MRNVDHTNLMKAQEMFTTQSSLKCFRNFYIVMEKMDCSLRDVVNAIGTMSVDGTKYKLSHEQVSFLAYQTLCGLQYLNRMGIIHRDLKPENMLVDEENMKLKISDFGKGLGLRGPLKDKLTCSAYTPYYAAPEQILDMIYKMAVDMWSIGIIIAELFKGELLCQHKRHDLQWQAIVEKFGIPGPKFMARLPEAKQSLLKVSQMLYYGPRPWSHSTMLPDRDDEPVSDDDRHSTDNLRDLVSKLLVVDLDRRMTVGQALRHPYVIKWYRTEEADAQPSAAYDASYEDGINTVEGWKEVIFSLLNKHIVDRPTTSGSASGMPLKNHSLQQS
ncbi:Jnk2 [Aphelenchoides avenae]|nr:Jnk2 [Aphelenchus avenae]